MSPRLVVLYLLWCITLCYAEETVETSTAKVAPVSTMYESMIVLIVAVCAASIVMVVILPTLVYQKYYRNNLKDQVV
ncbi:hypothetical protein ANTPLA_LOCUS4942 [Anthophora plagiata]